jgi:hypothetical protein
MYEIRGVSAMVEIHYKLSRSGVVENHLDELNFSLHYVLTLHTWMPKNTIHIHVENIPTSVHGHE